MSREEIGRKASIEGFANEKIACGLLMKKYANVSLVSLPLSPFDIIIVRKLDDGSEDIIRIQSRTATKSVKFMSGGRGGVDRTYKSGVKTYIQSPKFSDCIVGVHFNESKPELYFVPTVLIERLGTKSISIKKIEKFKDNYEILEKCKDKEFITNKAKAYEIID